MLVLYNFLQLAAVLLLFPVILPVVLLKKKYRGRVVGRLGFGLRRLLPEECSIKRRIWVHALSVGEVHSCKPLLAALRQEFPESCLLLSTTTATGRQTAAGLGPLADAVIPFPLDLWFSVAYFVRLVRPDCFILVETDFWPNFLFSLLRHGVPAFLVNGRISEKSSSAFIHHRRFFLPVFSSFQRLYMQTAGHAATMHRLGIEESKVQCLGNLKYDAALEYEQGEADGENKGPIGIRQGMVVVAGSTHQGEEEILFRCFVKLRRTFPSAMLVVAPRDIGRAGQIVQLAAFHSLACVCRSDCPAAGGYAVLVLDTFGELAHCYRRSDIAFIGGSLVKEGGHNPLEAAVFAKPVLFGPHMDDFSEISGDLLQSGGAFEVKGEEELLEKATALLSDEDLRQGTGQAAWRTVREQRGAAKAIAEDIRRLLKNGGETASFLSGGEDG